MTEKHSITITTTTAATVTAYSTSYVKGVVLMVDYKRSTSAPISSTADLSITTKDSSCSVLTSLVVGAASFHTAPRLTIVNTTNGAISNEGGLIPVDDERIAVAVTNSSAAAQTGTFYIYEQR